MLLEINPAKQDVAARVQGRRLRDFKLNERKLQGILFRSLDHLLPDNELVVLMQSAQWQEEPDILALDAEGNVYIFELKAWESASENLLQALRYGQIFGQMEYAELARLYERRSGTGQSLKEAHSAKFEVSLPESAFNRKQVFVVMTNGLDMKTREAIRYWRKQKLDIRAWIYRIYGGVDGRVLLEMSPFGVEDNPYEDVAEGFYILNTNIRNDIRDDEDMLKNLKAAAYFDPWKYKIEHLNEGDTVFLYRSGTGIVALGRASGKLKTAPYHGDPKDADEEFYMDLRNFRLIDPPMSPAEIKETTGVDYPFMGTMSGIDEESGRKLIEHLSGRERKP